MVIHASLARSMGVEYDNAIVMIDGDPTDNNAALFKSGYVAALKPKIRSAPGFQKVTRPSRSVAMTASEALLSNASPSPGGIFMARIC